MQNCVSRFVEYVILQVLLGDGIDDGRGESGVRILWILDILDIIDDLELFGLELFMTELSII